MELSPLYRLSPELRNQIYEQVFSSRYAVTLQDQKCQHALTKTCRQMRRETLAMYYSLTSFNAHLDDGPATPLTTWIKVLGPETVCAIERINVWDLHMLQLTLHGLSATRRIFSTGTIDHKWYQSHHTSPPEEDELGDLGPRNDLIGKSEVPMNRTTYILRPLDIRFAVREIKDIFLALHSLGLGLARFHMVKQTNSVSTNEIDTTTEQLTSEYAIVPLIPFTIPSTIDPTMSTPENPWMNESSHRQNSSSSSSSSSSTVPTRTSKENIYAHTNTLPLQLLLLSEEAIQHLQTQLSLGETTITIREKRRVIILDFEMEESPTTRSGLTAEWNTSQRTTKRALLKDFRQAMLSEASHEMLHSVVGAMRNWRAIP
ncbi:hypothetical protein CERZMDRAFT_84777 [Cercospora zeae-maydis SCOH1-5]|uniref:F-box domain-containing protein n=1 Tax=Cercospora zeae-maydis SCOH1-5 TaxID=717836 RepID=A0A6A6FG30_9PEZI|nr:hypothetical protein CERZMDRAFT_84777 [Cercospora zeae-maydis SCOH1-5]